MGINKIVGIALLVVGTLVLVYGGFSYTTETHNADLGPIEFQVQERERVNIPVWAGAGLIALGAIAFLVDRRR